MSFTMLTNVIRSNFIQTNVHNYTLNNPIFANKESFVISKVISIANNDLYDLYDLQIIIELYFKYDFDIVDDVLDEYDLDTAQDIFHQIDIENQ